MNKGTWLFALVVGGYVLFELTLVHRLGYRMEADNVLDQLVSAQHAVAQCSSATPAQKKKFGKRLALLKDRAGKEMATSNPALRAEQVVEQLATRVSEIRQSVDASIAAGGCESADVLRLMNRYTIYAGRR